MTGPERIAEAFASSGKHAALMPYLMAGFPDLATSLEIGKTYAEAGADLIEVGIPFSDPLADGPVIHAAGTSALQAGVTVEQALDVAQTLAEQIPVVVMCYINPVLAWGEDEFVRELAGRGVSGLIVPDLPYEEADELCAVCTVREVALVPLAAPTSAEQRLKRIGARAQGFLYTVGVVGTTGERSGVSDELPAVIARAKSATEVPVAVGFGVATPEDAVSVAEAGADGVIVGSRLVRAAGGNKPVEAVEDLVRKFATALGD